jgi:sporulation protein YlmC with PRC-barrel domain
MKTPMYALAAIFLFAVPAHGQTPVADAKITAPIAGVDDAAVVRSARASKLIGSKIYKGDTSIGQIEDVLVDLDRSGVAAVVLSVGGFLGMGDKLVAVPTNQIKVGTEARFTTDLTKEQLANAPAFVFGTKN